MIVNSSFFCVAGAMEKSELSVLIYKMGRDLSLDKIPVQSNSKGYLRGYLK